MKPLTLPALSLIALTAALLLAPAPAHADEADPQARIAELEAEVAQLRRDNAALRQALKESQQKIAAIEQKNQTLSSQLTTEQARAATAMQENQRLEQSVREAEAQQPNLVDKQFDPTSGRTTLSVPATNANATHGTRADTTLAFSHSFPGQQPPASASGIVTLDVQAFRSGGIYRTVNQATLIADGKEYKADLTDYESVVRWGGSTRNRIRLDDESFSLKLPIESIRAAANAQDLELQIGRATFRLDRLQSQSLRQLLANAGG